MNWQKYTNEITIEGKTYRNLPEGIQTDYKKTGWVSGHIKFINQFLSELDYIEVKTSGSTGKPKNLQLKKSTLVASAINTGNFFKLKRGQKSLLCLPGQYIAGKMMIVRAFVLRMDLYWQKPSSIPIIDREYDFAAMTPMQVENILKNKKQSLNKIKILIIGGAPVNDFIIEAIQELETGIYETYGMTETASHIALKKLNGIGKSEYFQTLQNIEIDKDNNSCLQLTNSNLNIGTISTNDIIELKDKNHFKWLGRADNIINSGGIKLFPEQIEKKLKSYIKTGFFIFGINDKKYGQVPAIVIESSKNENDIDFSVLDKYEVPQRIFYYKKFLKTKSGKIKRKETVNKILQN